LQPVFYQRPLELLEGYHLVLLVAVFGAVSVATMLAILIFKALGEISEAYYDFRRRNAERKRGFHEALEKLQMKTEIINLRSELRVLKDQFQTARENLKRMSPALFIRNTDPTAACPPRDKSLEYPELDVHALESLEE